MCQFLRGPFAMASPCPHCENHSFGCVEILEKRDDSGILKHIQEQELEVNFGAGLKEKLNFDDASEKYMTRFFPQLDKKVYCCPPVYEYVHPGEPTDIVQAAKENEQVPFLKFNYDTLQRERMGETAEEECLKKFLKMFEVFDVPSFVVHGYNWKTNYLKNLLKVNPKLSTSFRKIKLKEGEIDLLISLPGKCLMVVEVKAISHVVNFTNVVKKAFAQCKETSRFLSIIGSDLYKSKDIYLLKVVALPSVHRDILGQYHYCQNCLCHIITEENFASVHTLHDWFKTLLKLHSDRIKSSQFDSFLHKLLIGRLIGPASLMEVKPTRDELSKRDKKEEIEVRTLSESIPWTVRQITDEHGTAQKIIGRHEQLTQTHREDPTSVVSQWFQLNPEQMAVKFGDPKRLWLTGQPASGKTVLLLMKIDEILGGSTDDDESGVDLKSNMQLVASTDLQERPVATHSRSGISRSAIADCISTPKKLTLSNALSTTAGTVVASAAAESAGPNRVEPFSDIDRTSLSPDSAVASKFPCDDDLVTSSSSSLVCSKDDVEESVIYVFTGITLSCLSQVIEARYSKTQNKRCKVIVTALRHFVMSLSEKPKSKSFHWFGELPFWIDVLQKKHPKKVIHIFFDEAPYLLEGHDWDQFKAEWGSVFDSKRLGYVWVVQSTYYNEVDTGTRVPYSFSMVHLTYVMRLSRQNIEIANMLLKDIKMGDKFLNKELRSGHAVSGLRPVMYRIKCVCDLPKDSFICKECYDKRIVVLLQHALGDFQVEKKLGSISERQFGLKDSTLICTDWKKVADLLGHISPEIHFAVNRYALLDMNCMAVCGIDEFRGCERSLVIVDFHNAACEDLKMKEAVTRTLGQLVILDCGTYMPEVYEEQMQKMRAAELEGIIEIREIERTAEEMRKLNLIYIRYVTNRGKTLMNLTDSK